MLAKLLIILAIFAIAASSDIYAIAQDLNDHLTTLKSISNKDTQFAEITRELFIELEKVIRQSLRQKIDKQQLFLGVNQELNIVPPAIMNACSDEEEFLSERMLVAIQAFRNHQTALGLTELISAFQAVKPKESNCVAVAEQTLEFLLPIARELHHNFKGFISKVFKNAIDDSNLVLLETLSMFKHLVDDEVLEAGKNAGIIVKTLFNGTS